MGFIMEGLDKEQYDRTYSDRQLLRRILTYFRPDTSTMLTVAGMVTLTSLLDSSLPILIARGLDSINPGGPIGTRVWTLVALILLAGSLSWVINFLRQSRTARVVGDVVLRLRTDAFKAVMDRDMSFYDENPSGRIVSRVTSDTEDFSTVVTLFLNLVSQLLLIVIITVALFMRNWQLALVAMAMVPVIMGAALAFRKIARNSTRLSQRATAEVNRTVQETMSGISVAKAFRQEERIYSEFVEVNSSAYRVNLRNGFIFNSIFPILFTVAGIGTTAMVYFGGWAVIVGAVSAGDWYLFLQSVALFWFPLTSIASFWSQFQQGLSAAERVFSLIDATPRVVQREERDPGKIRGEIEFSHVEFSYKQDQLVLPDFSLKIAAGETVALVGHTGAGKSTIGRLLTRFYEFQGGTLLVDGQDIRAVDLALYRRQLGVVPQTPFLFSGTVSDNIRYPRQDATDAEIEAACRKIGNGEWLEVLPNGLETAVGEQGKGLSMGQRQLVALARILIQDPAIVILDEATASVDPMTEEQIQEGLDIVLAGRTSIVIAHRLSTIRHVDRIIVMRQGRIVEEGPHDALVRSQGEYADLYNTYFRHQSPDYVPGSGFVPVQAADD